MLLEEPYFMKNKEWYYHDKKEWKYKLTNKAPKKAIESYNKFYNLLDNENTMNNDIFTTGNCFETEQIRKNLIKQLENLGYLKEKIEELIGICDEAYNKYKIPYPTVKELIKDAN